ncbi:hypothetical protein ACXET9_13620 [Brachybacterium sp. DNPG3]
MIDIDVALRLQLLGLVWEPADGDRFAIDNDQLRDEAFMLSSMVVERGISRTGGAIFRFNGTTEWALDSVEQHEAVWLPRADQLLDALGEAFRALRREEHGYVVEVALPRPVVGPDAQAPDGGAREDAAVREIRAPHAEDALAGALVVVLTALREPAGSRTA